MNVLERFIVFFFETSIIIFCTQNMNLITNKTLSIDYLSRTHLKHLGIQPLHKPWQHIRFGRKRCCISRELTFLWLKVCNSSQ